MPETQVVVSDPQTGKAYKLKVGEESALFVGKRIGDVIDGDVLGLRGYKLEIKGGSDKEGIPMRKDVEEAGRKRILIASGPCYRPKERGKRRRKSVRGREISAEIAQINVKIKEYGIPINELLTSQKEEVKKEKR
jgi:small subunit ribosomal protein S6e